MTMGYHASGRFPATSFRLFSVYGPRERPEKLFPRLIESILSGTAFPLYEGAESHSRSFTYTRDIVNGLVRAVEDPDLCAGEIFNIGSDEEFQTLDAIHIVEDILGAKARIEKVPGRPGDQIRTAAQIDKIRERLGYAPTVSLEEGLRETVAWFQQLSEA
jgi:nucleoside-diphosphate-sugar epimerase